MLGIVLGRLTKKLFTYLLTSLVSHRSTTPNVDWRNRQIDLCPAVCLSLSSHLHARSSSTRSSKTIENKAYTARCTAAVFVSSFYDTKIVLPRARSSMDKFLYTIIERRWTNFKWKTISCCFLLFRNIEHVHLPESKARPTYRYSLASAIPPDAPSFTPMMATKDLVFMPWQRVESAAYTLLGYPLLARLSVA